jgi:hypothetical protein
LIFDNVCGGAAIVLVWSAMAESPCPRWPFCQFVGVNHVRDVAGARAAAARRDELHLPGRW